MAMFREGETAGYFIVRSGEDGTHIDGPLSVAEVQARITPDEHGETYYGSRGFHASVPSSDKGYWNEREGEEKILIIRGEIVVPKATKVAVAFSLEAEGTQ